MEPADLPLKTTPGVAGWIPQTSVMRHLDVSRTTLYRWRTELGLESATVGGRVFYSVEAIDALMRRSTSGGE